MRPGIKLYVTTIARIPLYAAMLVLQWGMLWVMRGLVKTGADINQVCGGWFRPQRRERKEQRAAVTDRAQQKEEDAAMVLVVCDYRLAESEMRRVTGYLERTRAGIMAKATAADRHLYAVARPTREEMLERIRNVLTCATPEEAAAWSKEAENRFGETHETQIQSDN